MKHFHVNELAISAGFQIESGGIPIGVKVPMSGVRNDCGYTRIDRTSFTSPKPSPALRHAEEVRGSIRRAPALNKGLARLRSTLKP